MCVGVWFRGRVWARARARVGVRPRAAVRGMLCIGMDRPSEGEPGGLDMRAGHEG